MPTFLEVVVFWSTTVIAMLGGLSTLTARCLEQCHRQALGQYLFFSAMFLVAVVTLLALASGLDCWFTGGATLLFMCLVGTIDSGRRSAPQSW